MQTKYWICDTCGGAIARPQDGWIEWLDKYEDGKRTGRGFRLVHKYDASPREGTLKCQYDGRAERLKDGMTLSDTNMTEFMGPNGLMELLGMLSDDELPKQEVIEMIKRLHIPGYEIARGYFIQAISDGAFDPNTKSGFHTQSDIAATIEWAEKNGEIG